MGAALMIAILFTFSFTTTESEMIVNYPIRRRIVVILMILGNVGLASTSATIIVSFVGAGSESSAIIEQVLLFLGVIALVLIVMRNKALDRLMCGVIGHALITTTTLRKRQYHLLLQLGNGVSIGEHLLRDGHEGRLDGLSTLFQHLTLLGIRTDGVFDTGPFDANHQLSGGDILVCAGPDADHEAVENAQ